MKLPSHELRLVFVAIFVSIMLGFTFGQMVEHRNTQSANAGFDRCLETTKKCINYLEDCRSGR